MDLRQDPWLPLTTGTAPLDDVLGDPGAHGDFHTGRTLTDLALLRFVTLLHARGLGRLPAGLPLYGDRAFMQLPAELTAELPDTPVHALDLTQASGRDVTLLTRTLDAHPGPRDAADAARTLLTYQAFAPSRGLTRWKPGKDTPGSRSVLYHAVGETLADTLALNTVPGLQVHSALPWERDHVPDWSAWREGRALPLDPANTHAYPWRSVTLRPDAGGQVRWAAQASGPLPLADEQALWPDPHTHREAIAPEDQKKRGGIAFDRRRNPQSREVMSSLALTLRATLQGDPLAPHSFREARQRGAAHVRAGALITRSGQPVILNITEATLPWPSVAPADAVAALDVALDYARRTQAALHGALKKSGVTASEVREGPAPAYYWQTVWPWLSLALRGGLGLATLRDAAYDAATRAADSLAPAMGAYTQAVLTTTPDSSAQAPA